MLCSPFTVEKSTVIVIIKLTIKVIFLFGVEHPVSCLLGRHGSGCDPDISMKPLTGKKRAWFGALTEKKKEHYFGPRLEKMHYLGPLLEKNMVWGPDWKKRALFRALNGKEALFGALTGKKSLSGTLTGKVAFWGPRLENEHGLGP